MIGLDTNVLARYDVDDAGDAQAYRACQSVASFDDGKFARRAKRLGMTPKVTVLV